MTYLADRAIAPPGQEGWTRHQEKYREASFDGADGVVVQDQTENVFEPDHTTPSARANVASQLSFDRASTPPRLRRGEPGRDLTFL